MDLDRFCLLVLCVHALCIFIAAWWLGRRQPVAMASSIQPPVAPVFQRRISGPGKHGPFQFSKKGCC